MEEDLKKRHKLLGHKFPRLKRQQVIRINTLKIKEQELLERLNKAKVSLKKIPYLKHGYSAKSIFSLGSMPEYLMGYFYIQETASQCAVEILNPEPEQNVLDCCASPGGKTTQIAQHMNNTGFIVALDNKSRRLASLKANLERCGINNTAVFLRDITYSSNDFCKFDKILVDAPCSGNYVVDPEWFEKHTFEDIQKNAYLQYNIMKAIIEDFADKDTEIVYSTCSLEPEENEFLIQRLIDDFKIKLQKVNLGSPALTDVFDKKLDKEIEKCARFWPDVENTQPFFIAKFKLR